MTINVWSDSMQHIELLGKPALFSDSRVNRSTVPDGWYVYDLRGSDYDPDLISTLEARVIVNYPKKIKRSVPHEHTENRPHPQTGHYDSG